MAASLESTRPEGPSPVAVRASSAVPAIDVAEKAPSLEHKANILIVDDREDKRLAMETIIADLDQNIFRAASGRDALRLLLKHEFAVILLDVNMPGMDGFETALLIRQRESLENVPIIFISAISDTETHLTRGYSLGAVDYILAPIVPEILRAKVAVFVELFKIADQVKRQAEDLRLAQRELEERVRQRTRELAVANEALQIEIKERQRAEDDLRDLNGQLEQRVAQRTAELRSANSELETFTYSIAHDVRAPFRQIYSYAEMLRDEFASSLPANGQRYLNRIAVKSKEMEGMVDDLLSLFTIAKQSLEFRDIDLGTIVQEVVSSLKGEVENRSIVFKVEPLPTLYCNYGLMKQAFDNLLSNAVKYTRPREHAVIEIGCHDQGGEGIIYVRDNGVGFEMENCKRLFGIFQRLHRPEEFEGTGVGLALVERIIRKHGGRIWAEGKVNEGASFYFTLGKIENDRE